MVLAGVSAPPVLSLPCPPLSLYPLPAQRRCSTPAVAAGAFWEAFLGVCRPKRFQQPPGLAEHSEQLGTAGSWAAPGAPQAAPAAIGGAAARTAPRLRAKHPGQKPVGGQTVTLRGSGPSP